MRDFLESRQQPRLKFDLGGIVQKRKLRRADRVGRVEKQSETGERKKNFWTTDQAGARELDREAARANGIGELDASIVGSREDTDIGPRQAVVAG